MGEFNILPKVGKNALNESYVVGQLYVAHPTNPVE